MSRTRKNADQLDLLIWAADRPTAEVVDFLARRERLPRWLLTREALELRRLELRFERACGEPVPPVIALRRA